MLIRSIPQFKENKHRLDVDLDRLSMIIIMHHSQTTKYITQEFIAKPNTPTAIISLRI